MKHAIIHISDLHVTTYEENDGTLNTQIASFLTTDPNRDSSNHYINRFINLINKDFPNGYEFTLLITGDISEKAEVEEFQFAGEFLTTIIKELNIPKERILLVPGDHDIHRRSILNELDKAKNSKPHLLHDIKFRNFSKLYEKIKGVVFPADKLIFDTIQLNEKIVLLGINSNYKISHKDDLGYLPTTELRQEFEALNSTIDFSDKQIIASWHHNITAGYDNTNAGQWNPDNRRLVISELERYGIKLVLTGNEHTDHAKGILSESIMASDCGSFASKSFDASFKVYPVTIEEKKIYLENRSYGLQNPNGNDRQFYWNIRPTVYSGQPPEFVLFQKNEVDFDQTDVVDLPESNNGSLTDQQTDIPTQSQAHHHGQVLEAQIASAQNFESQTQQRTFFEDEVISDKLYSIIKEKGLFHSGHFHWSETSRAHNWIDVAKMLEDYESLRIAQDAILKVIEAFSLNENCDLIIGLGYEGNILSTKPTVRYDIPYSSLPYSYRYNDHHDYEKKLNFDNSNGEFKKVMIITDVVNDGRTIRKLIGKREIEFFKTVETIFVVSLFYTGIEQINHDILNFDKLKKRDDLENDHAVNNIVFFTAKSLRVERCPYGKEYKTECFIYRDGLNCVHLFYNEDNSEADLS